MLGKRKIQIAYVWKSQKFRNPVFGKGKILNFNVWKSYSSEFQSVAKPKFRIPIFLEGRGW